MLNLSFRQQVFVGFAVSVILVFVVGLLSYRSINQSRNDSALVDHTQKVIKTSDELLQLLVDAETGMRGYAAAGKKALLDPYYSALLQINNDLGELKNLIPADNSIQLKKLEKLNSLVGIQLGTLKEDIETRDSKGLDYMVKNNMFLAGKQNMDQIRTVLSSINETENRLLTL